jgi:hypothetical protein
MIWRERDLIMVLMVLGGCCAVLAESPARAEPAPAGSHAGVVWATNGPKAAKVKIVWSVYDLHSGNVNRLDAAEPARVKSRYHAPA